MDLTDELTEELNELLGEELLVITLSDQLNLFGETFRPVFCGTLKEVGVGHITLYPVMIKMVNAPFYRFPIPISIPLEKITQFTGCFDCQQRIPLT
nr:hypothetical protein [Bacillus kwashiorkori]